MSLFFFYSNLVSGYKLVILHYFFFVHGEIKLTLSYQEEIASCIVLCTHKSAICTLNLYFGQHSLSSPHEKISKTFLSWWFQETWFPDNFRRYWKRNSRLFNTFKWLISCMKHESCKHNAIQHTSYIKEMSFRWASYLTSQQLKKKLPKENTVLNFIVCFTHLKALLFFTETNKKTSHKWLNMQLQWNNSIVVKQQNKETSDFRLTC